MEESILSFRPTWVFVSILARLAPVLLLAPPTHSLAVPRQVRTILTLAMALLLVPTAAASATSVPQDTLHFLIAIAGEVLLGLLLGTTILLSISSLQIAGQVVSQLAGFDFATTRGASSEEQEPLIASLFGWVAIMVLLLAGGHRYLMQCCLDSLTSYPIGAVQFQASWLTELEHLLTHTFSVGLRAAAPLAIALLLSNIVAGLVARTLPQFSILAVGFNLNALVLLMALFVSIGSAGWVYQTELGVWLESCQRMVSADR